MKIVVTGGAGFIGSHVVDAYIEAGHDVIVIDSLWSHGGGRLKNVNPKAQFYKLDIRSREAADLIVRERPEVLNLHAAQHSVKISTDDPRQDADVNVMGLLNMIEAAVAAGTRKIIAAGSGATFGTVDDLPITEATRQNPESPYGITKLVIQHYLHYYQQTKGLAYTVFHYGNVFGPRQDPTGEAGVIAIFAKRILEGREVRIDWDGEQQKDYVYVGDIARGNLLALDAGDNEMFCLASGGGTSVNELHRQLCDITGNQVPVVKAPKRPGDIYLSYFDCAKAARELGWTPQVDLRTGLQRTVESMR